MKSYVFCKCHLLMRLNLRMFINLPVKEQSTSIEFGICSMYYSYNFPFFSQKVIRSIYKIQKMYINFNFLMCDGLTENSAQQDSECTGTVDHVKVITILEPWCSRIISYTTMDQAWYSCYLPVVLLRRCYCAIQFGTSFCPILCTRHCTRLKLIMFLVLSVNSMQC